MNKREYCKCGTPIEDPDNLTRECLVCKSAIQPPMLCDRCQQPIFDLRLLKYQVYDTMQNRYLERKEWLCAKCWHNWQEWLDVTEPQTPDNADETLTVDNLDETASRA